MADTFSLHTVAPPRGLASLPSASVLQHTLHHLQLLLADSPHSHAGTWCQQRQRALLLHNRPRLQWLAGFRTDGSTDLLCDALTLSAP